jgi:ribosomal protein S18 acetylase RimI-like enzyme
MEIEFRTFKDGDEKIWVQIVNEAIADLKRQPLTIEAVNRFKKDPYFDPKGVFFAYISNEPVGICYVKVGAFFEVKKGHIVAFRIVPKYQGTEVEEALHERAITYLQLKGLKEAEVMLAEDERHLRDFFSSKGYKVHRVYLILKRKLDKIPSSFQIKGLKVQALGNGQIKTFVDVANKAFSDAFDYYDFEPATIDEVKQQMKMYNVSSEDVKIAYLKNQPVGYVYLIKGNLAGIGVVKEHRRKGIGSALLIEGLRHLKSKELEEVSTGVNAENKPAVNFFRKHGFKIGKKLVFLRLKF